MLSDILSLGDERAASEQGEKEDMTDVHC